MSSKAHIALVLAFALAFAGCSARQPSLKKQELALGYTVINSVSISDYSVELQIKGNFTSAYTVHKPRDQKVAVVELPDVALGDVVDKILSNKKGVSEVRFTMVQTPRLLSRIEISMDTPMDVEPLKLEHSLIINLLAESARKEPPKPAAMKDKRLELLPATEITSIGFKQDKKEIKLVAFGDGSMQPDIFTLKRRIIVDVPGVSMNAPLPDKVLYPVRAVRYGSYADKVRIVLDMEKDTDFLAATEDNTIVIAMPAEEPPAMPEAAAEEEGEVEEKVVMAEEPAMESAYEEFFEEEVPAGEEVAKAEAGAGVAGKMDKDEKAVDEYGFEQKYTGSPINLDFQNADIVPIFRMLVHDYGGYNVVIHPTVSGRITIKLKNVPWDQALDIILELSNLGKSLDGNIVRIAPHDIFVRQKEEEARLKASQQKAAELVQQAIHLNYISAGEMKTRAVESKLLSPRGTIRIDERTNTLILNDTEESIKKIRDEEIKYWDSPEHGTMQVLIEAKVVTVRTDYTHNFGIRWGGSATDDNFSWVNADSSLDFSVNTPVGGAGTGSSVTGALVSIGYTDTFNMELSLQALETVKKAKSLANPRVITIDRQSANISQGTSIPYATQADGGGTKIESISADLALHVTPEIQPNGIVQLDVSVTNNSPTIIAGASAPGIDTQQIKTKALVKDGETLVLGGIFTSSEDESEVRVPILHKLPGIGWLFKTRSVSKIPNELLIFITPMIIK